MARREFEVKHLIKNIAADLSAQFGSAKILAEAEGKKLLLLIGSVPGDKSSCGIRFAAAKEARNLGIEKLSLTLSPYERYDYETASLTHDEQLRHLLYFYNTAHLGMQPIFHNPYSFAEEEGGVTEAMVLEAEDKMVSSLASLNQDTIMFASVYEIGGFANSRHLENFYTVPIAVNYRHEPLPPGVFPLLENRQYYLETDERVIHLQSPALEKFSEWQILSLATSSTEWLSVAAKAMRFGRIDTMPALALESALGLN